MPLRFDTGYTNDYIRSVIEDELVAFPGVTKTMLNLRLKIRLIQSNTKVINQMIEDGEITIRYKHVPNVKRPVKVLYLPSQISSIDDSMVNQVNQVETVNNPIDTRY